jgi:hypothetical protein
LIYIAQIIMQMSFATLDMLTCMILTAQQVQSQFFVESFRNDTDQSHIESATGAVQMSEYHLLRREQVALFWLFFCVLLL